MKKLNLLLILILLFSSNLFAQKNTNMKIQNDLPPIIDIEVFFGDPEFSGAQISPDGNYISFRKPYNGIMNIWVKGIDEPFEYAKPLTADKKRPVTGYFWSRDSKFILFVQDNGGDENYRLYGVNPKDSPESETGVPKAKDFTPMPNVRVEIIGLPKSNHNEIILAINDRDPALHDVYSLNLETGERKLLVKNDANIAAWYADKNGVVKFALKQTETGGTELLSVQDNKFIPIYSVNELESVGFEGFDETNTKIYISSDKGDDVDLSRLILIDLASGKQTIIESDPENEVDFGGTFFSDKTEKLIATYYVADRVRYYFKDTEWEKTYNKIKSILPDGEVYFRSITEDEQKMIVGVTRDVDPGSVYLFDKATGEAKLLYKANPKIPTEYLSPMYPVKYDSRDNKKIPSYLTIPKGLEGKNLPVIIFPHGGPWARDNWGYNPFAQFLANRGYAVLMPNFRGSTGYGKKFLNAGNKEWGTGFMQHDLSDGVKYLIEQGIADPKRVAIMGGSYGGYATLAGLAFTPELYAAGVSIVGPSNLITLLNSIPPYWAVMKKIFDIRLGDVNNPEDVERMKSESPLFSSKNIIVPLLVIQGANDPRVKQAESDQIVVSLRDLKRTIEYLLAKDEGHGYAGKLNRMAMIAKIDRFLAKYLGGRYQETLSTEIDTRLTELTVDVNAVK
jgi:dipeptidyl aminopeptidase/acylaminoacyl peptidase